ncbi:hypothetical protein FFLO_05501 [Filobasidium floriforme]|uniref:Major facilitator superfamily (MFS) profile domain-containing protein n=1 Tax=Filobasidium floriforme TaxID=5210 RepID=A0A8K0NLE5_9TREE|nr:hypothetical protein FFLO_05501 [Filobasidium floriforme]
MNGNNTEKDTEYDLDEKTHGATFHIEHKDEYGTHGAEAEQGEGFEYPEALANMPEAPSAEVLRDALEEQRQGAGYTLLQQCRREWRLLLAASPYVVANIGYGFDNGAMNITAAMPAFLIKFGGFDPVTKRLSIASTWISLWTAMFSLGLFIGTISCTWTLDRFGPRKVTMAATVFLMAGVAVQVASETKETLLAGKLLTGIPLGVIQVAASNFIAESSPARLRGPLAATIGMANVVGIILGITTGSQVIHYAKSDWKSWKFTLAMQWVAPALTLVMLPFSTTSPVYLVKRGRPAEAAKALVRLHGLQDDVAVKQKLAVIQYAVATEMQMRPRLEAMTLKELFTDRVERKRTLTSIGLWFCYQAGGNTFTGQGLYFLQQQGLKITTATNISLGCLSVSAIVFLLGGYVMERVGRRVLFVYFHILHFALMLALGCLGFAIKSNAAAGWAVAVLINLAISTQSFATGGTAYALTAEISSVRARAKTQSLSLFTNKILNFGLTFAVPYIYQEPGYLGAKTALIFAGTTALAIVWAFFMVPETAGRSAIDIDALYHAGVPPRKFADIDVETLKRSQSEQGPGHAPVV